MKMPKYIEQKLDRRAKLAMELMNIDSELTEWIEKNAIVVEDYDYCTGIEMYANPYASVDRIKEAIRRK